MAQYIPAPNSGTNQFTFNPTQTGSGNYQEIVRVDHTFNRANAIWAE